MRSGAFDICVELACDCPGIDEVDLNSSSALRCCAPILSEACSNPRRADNSGAFLAFAKNLQISFSTSPVAASSSAAAEVTSILGIFVPPSVVGPAVGGIVSADIASCGLRCDKDVSESNDGGGDFDAKGDEITSIVGAGGKDYHISSNRPRKLYHCYTWTREKAADKIRRYLEGILPGIHPSLSCLCILGAICTSTHVGSTGEGLASDIVLLEARNQIEGRCVLEKIQGECMGAAQYAVIRALPICRVSFVPHNVACLSSSDKLDVANGNQSNLQVSGNSSFQPDFRGIPSCPVCLHRIDPRRLGLPKPKNHQLCSQFCATIPETGICCNNMKFLNPWPHPAKCDVCKVIWNHWNSTRPLSDAMTVQNDLAASSQLLPSSANTTLMGTTHSALVSPCMTGSSGAEQCSASSEECVCYKCRMKETLWVCLSCAVVGCGRYSNKHAEEHYLETGHPYSLELVTQRIWDYATGEFAHRGDLLNCPSMRHRLGNVSMSGSFGPGVPSNDALEPPLKGGDDMHDQLSFDSLDASGLGTHCAPLNSHASHPDDPSPKKASMIGEEYEALLQSALEDQAQHYEFEITRLIAELTAKGVDEEKISENETLEIELLQRQISDLHQEADCLSRELLEVQGQEAGHRATYQRLLREQAVAKDLLEKIKEESTREQEEGNAQVAELEQQIVDLTANLQMREQIAKDEELSKAQIFGTSYVQESSKPKRGKKLRRSFRR